MFHFFIITFLTQEKPNYLFRDLLCLMLIIITYEILREYYTPTFAQKSIFQWIYYKQHLKKYNYNRLHIHLYFIQFNLKFTQCNYVII